MEKYFGEKQERFSFRKLSVGLVSATISSLFFMSVLASSSVAAQETKGVHYKYVTESELSSEEKKQLVYDIPTYVENDDETYYLVYKLNSQNQLGELPNTGSKNEMQALVAGASLAALGILVFAVSKKKIKNKTVLHLVLVAGIGNGILVSAHALENNLLLNYNTDYELTSGEKLPLPKDISGYTYIGYIKEGKTTSDSKVSNQEKSVATPIDQQKVDYTIAPNFIENPSKIQVINGQYEAVPEFRDGQVGTVATESAETKADTLSSDMNSEVESHSTPPTVDSSQNGENLGKQKEDATPVEKPKEVEETNKPEKDESKDETSTKPENSGNAITEENGQTVPTESNQGDTNKVGESNKPENNDSKNETSEKTVEEVPVNPTEGSTEGTSNQGTENPVQSAEESTTNSEKVSPDTSKENTEEMSSIPSDSTTSVEETNKPENSAHPITESGQTEPEQPKGNSTEDVSTESNTANSNGNEEIKQENEVNHDKKVENPEKTLELRNVSDIELYSHQTNGTYKQHVSLNQIPSNPDTYFVKVKSSTFKDVYLPVKSIYEELKDGRTFYKITAGVDKLQQEIDHKYVDNFSFYLAKKTTEETTNFTSFGNLVKAINKNLNGTYHLAASLNANEVELGQDETSYIKGPFTGKLIGEKDGKHYAIYNLKKPLFGSLSGATVEKLSLKDVTISGKTDIGSVANEAKNGTKINQVHVDGVLAGERGIGGLLAKAEQSSITDSSFKGRLVNTYETTAAYNIGGLVGHLTGSNALIDKSKATITISSNANQSNQTVGGLAGLVDKDAHISNSYAEGDINNVKHFGKVAGVAGYLWDKDSNDEGHSGRLTNVLSDVNVTNGNAITGYHFTGMRETEAFSNKSNRVYNVTLEKDEVVTKESLEERGTILDASQITSKKAEINPLTLPTVEPLLTSANKESDFSKVEHYQASRALVYKNIEKLLPFYNKATIVKYGNLVKENSHLYTKELLSAVMMKDDQVITDIISDKHNANKLLLHYQDRSSERLDLKYLGDFAKLAEYSLGDTGLIYTPNQFLYNRDSIIQQLLPELQQVEYQSDAVRNTLGISSGVKLTELYLEQEFAKTRASLEDSLKKLLSADAGLASDNQVMSG